MCDDTKRWLWSSLIFGYRNPLFADIPVESLVFEHQGEYYQALQESTRKTDSAPVIEFMLGIILDAILSPTPEVTPEVRLLSAFSGEMSRQQLQAVLGLKDYEHFRKAYLLPALRAGFIEMIIPDKPKSRVQKYRLTGKGRQRLQGWRES